MAAKKKKIGRLLLSEYLAGYLFALPFFIGFICFILWPLITSIYMGFTRYSILKPARFIGWDNYIKLLTGDPVFWRSLYNTFYMTIFGVPLSVIVGFALAMLLNMRVKAMAWYRAVYYLPSIIPIVASAVLWMWIFNPQYGYLNAVLAYIGITGPPWLGSPVWAKPAFVLMMLWGAGGGMIIYLAGLKNIPVQFYEAAEIDGANLLRRFLHITLPLMTPTLFFTTITGTIATFQIFTQAYIMTGGGPADATLFFVYYLYNNAFVFLKMGYASAMAWILFLIILFFTLIQLKIAPRWVHYEVREAGRRF